jgi:hydroxyethylthiazole kinase-like uncharacterized protein yjeF
MIKLPPIDQHRHKYQAGYVIGFAGSTLFPGASKLAALAAMKAGAGIVRIFYESPIGEIPLELISESWELKSWNQALLKAKAAFIGPGLGKSRRVQSLLKKHLKTIKIPCVIDADALLADVTFPPSAILTPHRGEILTLLQCEKMPKEDLLFSKIAEMCKRQEVIVVLKGSPTFIFEPHNPTPFVIDRGDPGMAKAGTGDVLTGMIAALLAQGLNPIEAAKLGVTLHAIAGEEAVKETTSYCMLATDLLRHLPSAFRIYSR